jgi:carboxyl-terminal processing protease
MFKKIRIVIYFLLLISLTACTISGCDLLQKSGLTGGIQGTVNEAWKVISKEYVDKSQVDSTEISRGAIKGMIEALNDPYSIYLTPEEYELELSHEQGAFGGIGATVGIRDGQIIVVGPIPGTPAASAGIKSGDVIMAVDGESIEGLSVEEVVLKIRGPEGTSVKVTILHEGENEPIELNLVRAMIDVPSLVYEMRDGIAYVRMYLFSERTDEELIPVLGAVEDSNAEGIILDLRSNTGGWVDTMVNIASYFLDSGVVIYLIDNNGNETSYSVNKQAEVRTDLPIVILTDNYSASASEALCGALQDYGRAIVAGTTTYGKGSANRWFELSDGSAILLTINRWATPNHRLIEGKGIEPDYALDLKGDDLVEWAIDYLKK